MRSRMTSGIPSKVPKGSGVADGLLALSVRGPVQAELPGDDLLGEISLGDEGGDDVDVFGLYGVEHVAHGGLLFPEALDDLVELSGLPDRSACS